jgi:hypothetical protein
MQRALLLSLAATALACGDNLEGPPARLEDDPAIEQGCRPLAADFPFSRLKRVACAEELPEGLLVAGRVGDILLENDKVQVVVRGHGEGYLFPETPPGGIVDAARRGADDQVKEIYPLVELNIADAEEIALVEAGDDGPATLVVRGPAIPVPLLRAALGTLPLGAFLETRYVLEPGAEHLVMTTQVTRIPGEASPSDVQVGDVLFFGGAVVPWMPGTGVPSGVTRGPFFASSGSPTTSYGIAFPPAEGEVQFVNIQNVKGVVGPRRSLVDPDAPPAPVERWLIIGDGSASSVSDAAYRLRSDETETLSARLDRAPGPDMPWVDVQVSRSGEPVTLARVADDAPFEVELPHGDYELQAVSIGNGIVDPVDVATGNSDPATVPLGTSGVLRVVVTDTADLALPARVTIRRPEADFEQILYSDATGVVEVALPAGTYQVDVSRGVEYDAFTDTGVAVSDGETTELAAVIERVIDTSGWIAIDTHLHSEMSNDSVIPLADRLRAVAGEGIELAISTDHDFLTDYGPLLHALGLESWVAYRIGCELSSLIWGHVNSWPLTPDYDRAGAGSFAWYGKSPGQMFDTMRAAGAHVVQVNHPRRGGSGLFNSIDFDPETATALRDPAELGLDGADFNDFDFDAIEVANGKSDPFDETFRDWLALVSIGHPAAGTGSSDSHGISQYVGSSRTYVWVGPGADDPSALDLDAIDEALRARAVTVSQGAFVTAAIRDPVSREPTPPGVTASLAGETSARIQVTVQAPPWMPLARIQIYAGRELAKTIELNPADTGVVRYNRNVLVPLPDGGSDSFFVVLVETAGPGTPVLGETDPSFTNPLLYDADGDGVWSP